MFMYGDFTEHKFNIKNQVEAKEQGFPLVEIESAYDGTLWEKGYAPQKPVEVKKEEVRQIRNSYLEATDKYMIIDFPISDQEREEYKGYRTYLRDFTEMEEWWTEMPLTFDEWKQVVIESSDEVENV